MREGTTKCVQCGTDFSDVECCCDEGTLEDGSHIDGICMNCCGPHPSFKNNFGSYERMDCDI